jgi:hypothetical protein
MRKTQEIIIIGIALCLWWIVSSSAYADKAPNNSQTTGFVLTWCISRPLKVTAYYSPEAIQWVWFHGDYATEIKINGRGVHGASGKPVFDGMLAWPKKYPFGTTVSIPGVGVWGIYDRWSAIVSNTGFDVIDIWAGAGLQGMVNALHRGSKMLTGEICSWWLIKQKLWFDWRAYPARETASKTMIWSLDMMTGNNGLTVQYLQSFLLQSDYLKSGWFTPGHFDDNVRLALCKWQIDMISLDPDNEYCGYYGTNSRRKFAQLVKNGDIKLSLVSNQPTQSIKKLIRRSAKRVLKIR